MSDAPANGSPAQDYRGVRPDPWSALTARTPARVALGRAGGSLPTAELLRFALDHAEARDAVHAPLDVAKLTADLADLHRPILTVQSQAADHETYLRHPDRGRRLSAASLKTLQAHAGVFAEDGQTPEIALILADGLSATAVHAHGPALLRELLPRLAAFRIAPLVVAANARVALQDPIGHALRARCAVIVLGERPGLGTADSLGVYLVFDPKPGNTDADRNCVSNVRPAGLPPPAAADTVAYLIDAALTRRLSGVTLKDDRPRTLPDECPTGPPV